MCVWGGGLLFQKVRDKSVDWLRIRGNISLVTGASGKKDRGCIYMYRKRERERERERESACARERERERECERAREREREEEREKEAGRDSRSQSTCAHSCICVLTCSGVRVRVSERQTLQDFTNRTVWGNAKYKYTFKICVWHSSKRFDL